MVNTYDNGSVRAFHASTWALLGFATSFLLGHGLEQTQNILKFTPLTFPNVQWMESYSPQVKFNEVAGTDTVEVEANNRNARFTQMGAVPGFSSERIISIRVRKHIGKATRRVRSPEIQVTLDFGKNLEKAIQSERGQAYIQLSMNLQRRFDTAVQVAFDTIAFNNEVNTQNIQMTQAAPIDHVISAPIISVPVKKVTKHLPSTPVQAAAVKSLETDSKTESGSVPMNVYSFSIPTSAPTQVLPVASEVGGIPITPSVSTQYAANTPVDNKGTEEITKKAASITGVEYSAVEAFYESKPVLAATHSYITRSQYKDAGWELWEAPDHISTLAWVDRRTQGWNIPLIRNVNIQMLARLSKRNLSIQSGEGVVFGKVGGGMSIRIPGYSAQVILLNKNLEPVVSNDPAATYFLAVGMRPGMIMIEALGRTKKLASVHVPVRSAAATFLDFSDSAMQSTSVSGAVFDAASGEYVGVDRAQVRIVGNTDALGVTDIQGKFKFEGVITSRTIPYYIEISKPDEYTHRYQVDPARAVRNFVFFQNDQVNDWLAQLAGGVSEQTGMIVGAMQSSENGKVKITDWESRSNFKPELYRFNQKNELTPLGQVTNGMNRIAGVQVSEGLQQMTVRNELGDLLFSDLEVVNQGVITVLENVAQGPSR